MTNYEELQAMEEEIKRWATILDPEEYAELESEAEPFATDTATERYGFVNLSEDGSVLFEVVEENYAAYRITPETFNRQFAFM